MWELAIFRPIMWKSLSDIAVRIIGALPKYQELSKHCLCENAEESVQSLAVNQSFIGIPSGGLLFPLQFDREIITVLNHEIRAP